MARLCETTHFWALQLRMPDKELREILVGVEADGRRGKKQPTYFLGTVHKALLASLAAEKLDGHAERARKDKESADKLALENAERRGELGLISEIADVIGDHIGRCCTRLDQIPDALGQLCESRVASIVVPECRRLIGQARGDLAADMAAIGSSAGRPMDPATGSDSEPVVGRESTTVERKQRRARAVAN